MEIPIDVINYLAGNHLEFKQVLGLASAAKKYRYIGNEDAIWKRLVERKFLQKPSPDLEDGKILYPKISWQELEKNTHESYRKLFFQLHRYENIFQQVDHASLQVEASKPLDYLVKIVVVGDSGAGKTSLQMRFAKNEFLDQTAYTIGVDFFLSRLQSTVEVGGRPIQVKLQLWDSSPRERVVYYGKSAFRGVHAVLIVFDVTDRQSFEGVGRYRDWMIENMNNKSHVDCVVLVGNKVDLEESRVVSTEEAQRFADERHILYAETSAKTGFGVNAAICTAVSIAVQTGMPRYQPPNSNPAPVQEKSSRCIIS